MNIKIKMNCIQLCVIPIIENLIPIYINETKTFPNKDTHVTYLHLYNVKDIDLR